MLNLFGLCVTVGFAGLVSSCHRIFGYFVGLKIFSREFSLDPKFFLVATSKLLYVGIS